MQREERGSGPVKILVVSAGNSCRSQMAEGWIRYYSGDAAEVYSAGIEAHGLSLYTVRSMMEAVLDISGYKSKSIEELPVKEFDFIITLCDEAWERSKKLSGSAERIHRPLTDPALVKGSEEEIMRAFNAVRDETEDFAFDFVHNNIRSLIPDDLESIL